MKRLLAVLALIIVGASTARGSGIKVTIGVLAPRGGDTAAARWQPTADYLSRQIPRHHFLIRPLTLEGMRKATANRELAFVLTNPGNYVDLESSYGISRLVTLRTRYGDRAYTRFGAVVFCRADREDIRHLSDLKGKSFMAVDKNAFGGFQLAWRALKEHGVDPFHDLSRLVFAGFPQDAIVYAVRDGIVDAGTVRTDILEHMAAESKIDIERFRILDPQTTADFPFRHTTRLYPEWPFAKSRQTPDQLAQQVAVALLTMPADNPAAKTGRYADWTVPLDYYPVHELYRELGIGPYRQDVSPAVLLRAYWHWIVLGIGAIVLMATTTAYALKLNRKLKASKTSLEKEINERRRAQAQMQKLSSALQQTADTVVITNRDGVIEYVNPAFEQLTGYSHGEVAGKKPNLLKSGKHDDELYARLWKTIVNGRVFSDVLINRRKDGSLFYTEETITPLRDGRGEIVYFVATGKDITDRVLADERSRQHEAQLAHVSRLSTMGEMASALAHELNQPLAAIVNYAQGCVHRLETGASDPGEFGSALRQITAQAQRSGEIIRHLRNFMRKSEPRRTRTEINEVVREAAGLASLEARQRRIGLRLDLTNDLPPVQADTIQLEQVVLNLVRNAMEAIHDAEPEVREVTIRTGRRPTGEIEVLVQDSGPGLRDGDTEQIFETFFTTKEDGMGMGLSISRSIIKAHGGRMLAAPGEGGGASFGFTLPGPDEPAHAD